MDNYNYSHNDNAASKLINREACGEERWRKAELSKQIKKEERRWKFRKKKQLIWNRIFMWLPFPSKVFNLWDETMIRSAGKNSTTQPTNQKKSRILESKGVYSHVFLSFSSKLSFHICRKTIFLYFLNLFLRLI